MYKNLNASADMDFNCKTGLLRWNLNIYIFLNIKDSKSVPVSDNSLHQLILLFLFLFFKSPSLNKKKRSYCMAKHKISCVTFIYIIKFQKSLRKFSFLKMVNGKFPFHLINKCTTKKENAA